MVNRKKRRQETNDDQAGKVNLNGAGVGAEQFLRWTTKKLNICISHWKKSLAKCLVESNKKSGSDLPPNDSYTNQGETPARFHNTSTYKKQKKRAETRSKVNIKKTTLILPKRSRGTQWNRGRQWKITLNLIKLLIEINNSDDYITFFNLNFLKTEKIVPQFMLVECVPT